MMWKVIGQSVIGISHEQNQKVCDDRCQYRVIQLPSEQEALICFVSDGAGSAKFAATAAESAVAIATESAAALVMEREDVNEKDLFSIVELIYDHLQHLANQEGVFKNEYSCTLLGCIILENKAGFLQIGDGAIVCSERGGQYHQLWWPENGEYQNTTYFVIDDKNLPNLNVRIIEDEITELAIFTDGLQQLALNYTTSTVHQPFFKGLFPSLRKATEEQHLSILSRRLAEYLSGEVINSRTDDDKTLVLATRE